MKTVRKDLCGIDTSTASCSMLDLFFSKQKTAYEVRISDWSSDVCSSDLVRDALLKAVEIGEHQFGLYRLGIGDGIDAALDMGHIAILEAPQHMNDGVHFADIG